MEAKETSPPEKNKTAVPKAGDKIHLSDLVRLQLRWQPLTGRNSMFPID